MLDFNTLFVSFSLLANNVISHIVAAFIIFMELLILQLFLQFNCYETSNIAIIANIRKNIIVSQNKLENQHCGIIFGKYFFGQIIDDDEHAKAKIYCRKTTYQSFEKLIEVKINLKKSKRDMQVCYNIDNKLKSFTLATYPKIPTIKQRHVISKITELFNDDPSGNVVMYLHGKPGTGKSYSAFLLAQELHGIYCDIYDPTDPCASSFEDFFVKMSPNYLHPLILVIEEVDVLIQKIHDGNNNNNNNNNNNKNNKNNNNKNQKFLLDDENSSNTYNNLNSQMRDKKTYNTFMDRFNKGIHPCTIIMLISNKNPTEINNLDPSYIRAGRVNIIANFDNPIENIFDKTQQVQLSLNNDNNNNPDLLG